MAHLSTSNPHMPIDALGDDPMITLWALQRRFGMGDHGDARFMRYVGALIAGEGFPPPLPSALRGGGLTREVTRHSRWIRPAVEAWLHDFLPPANADAIDAQAMARAADAMDARAAGLGLSLIKGGRA